LRCVQWDSTLHRRTLALDVSVDDSCVDVLSAVRSRLPQLPAPASGHGYWLQQVCVVRVCVAFCMLSVHAQRRQAGGALCPPQKSLLELRVQPHELLTLVERPGADVGVVHG
jgi:hypothetical protein